MKQVPKLHNTVERQKAQHIYDTYFNPDSEHVLDFEMLNTLNLYHAVTDEELEDRIKDFERWGDNLLRAMEDYDKNLLKNLHTSKQNINLV